MHPPNARALRRARGSADCAAGYYAVKRS